jgi:hypothetical protein
MKTYTNFVIDGDPVVVVKWTNSILKHIDVPLITQVKILYKDGATGYVSPNRLEILDNPVLFKE